MTIGNAWLPEDLLYGIAKFADGLTKYNGKFAGLFGSVQGKAAQDFLRRNHRPLVWSNSDDGKMLLDPIVGQSVLAGARITDADIELFTKIWTTRATALQWTALVAKAPAHLKLSLPSWLTRTACAEVEKSDRNMVLGTDGNGDCVYFVLATPDSTSKWELLNDGSCVQSASERAVFSTEADCSAAHASWKCVKKVFNASYPDAHYCVPAAKGDGAFTTAAGCEAGCVGSGPWGS